MERDLTKIYEDNPAIQKVIVEAIKLLQKVVGDSLTRHNLRLLSTNEIATIFSSIYATLVITAIEWVGTKISDSESDAESLKGELTRSFMRGFWLLGTKRGHISKMNARSMVNAFGASTN